MMRCRQLTAEVLAPGALARDVLAGRSAIGALPLPRRLDDLEPPPEQFEAVERRALVEELEASLAPITPHVAVLDALRALRAPGACAIVTGQQPGFLATPLYSLYKALQATRLARLCAQRWERPVVALFWNHADDHDIAEVHHVNVVNVNLDLQKIALPGLSSGRIPLAHVVLDEDRQRLSTLRALLAQIHAGAPHLERAFEIFFPRSGESLARAFTRSMTELCGPLGLIVVEPQAIRARASDALARIVGEDPLPALRSGAEELRALGYDVPIEPHEAALVFRHEREAGRVVRRALRPGGDGFRYDGESGSRTPAELAAEIVEDKDAWSPGALLRPLVQDLCLPVAAYIGGWGELAYHAELGPLRRARDLPRTPFVPRSGCTLVDPECRVSLAKLGLDVEEVLRARGEIAQEPDVSDAPEVAGRLREVAERAAHDLVALRGELSELDPSLSVQLKRTAEQVRSVVDKLAEKAERVHQNHTGKGRRHERRLANALYPRGEPQERVLGPFPFVARFGEAWIEDLAGAIDPFGADHLVVEIGAPSASLAEETP